MTVDTLERKTVEEPKTIVAEPAAPPWIKYCCVFVSPSTLPPRPARIREIHIRPEARRMWCAALRSGMWTQIYGVFGHGSQRCALGVLHAIMTDQFRDDCAEFLGLSAMDGQFIAEHVIGWNDALHLTFKEIADRIEKESWNDARAL